MSTGPSGALGDASQPDKPSVPLRRHVFNVSAADFTPGAAAPAPAPAPPPPPAPSGSKPSESSGRGGRKSGPATRPEPPVAGNRGGAGGGRGGKAPPVAEGSGESALPTQQAAPAKGRGKKDVKQDKRGESARVPGAAAAIVSAAAASAAEAPAPADSSAVAEPALTRKQAKAAARKEKKRLEQQARRAARKEAQKQARAEARAAAAAAAAAAGPASALVATALLSRKDRLRAARAELKAKLKAARQAAALACATSAGSSGSAAGGSGTAGKSVHASEVAATSSSSARTAGLGDADDKARREARRAARVAAEAEARRLEAEAVNAENAATALAEEEARVAGLVAATARLVDLRSEALSRVTALAERTRARLARLEAVSPAAMAPLRDAAYKRGLKADVRKGTALPNRVVGLTDASVQPLLKDIAEYNFSRYISEVAVALPSDKLKPADLEPVTQVAVALHQRYPEFLPCLLEVLESKLTGAVGVTGVGAGASGAASDVTGTPPGPAGGNPFLTAARTLPASGSAAARTSSAAAGASGTASGGRDAGVSSSTLSALEDVFGGGGGGARLGAKKGGSGAGAAAAAAPAAAASKGAGANAGGSSGGLASAGAAGAGAGGVTVTAVPLPASDEDKDPKVAAARLRVTSRLWADLVLGGLCPNPRPLLDALTSLMVGASCGALAASAAAKAAAATPSPAAASNPFASPRVTSCPAPSGITVVSTPSMQQGGTKGADPKPSGGGAGWTQAAWDAAARRALRDAPIMLPLLKAHGQELTGIVPSETRVFLSRLVTEGSAARLGAKTATAGGGLGAEAAARNVNADLVAAWAAAAATGAAPDAGETAVVPASPSPAPGAPLGVQLLEARPWRGPALAPAKSEDGDEPATSSSSSPVPPLDGSWKWVPPLPPASELPLTPLKSPTVTPAEQAALRVACDRYFDLLCRAVDLERRALRRIERRNELTLYTRGELQPKHVADAEAARAAYDRALGAATALADLLDRELPNLALLDPAAADADDDEDGVGSGSGGGLRFTGRGGLAVSLGPFDDEPTFAFYRRLPALRDMVPDILLDPEGAAAAAAAAAAESAVSLHAGGVNRGAGLSERHNRGDLDGALSQLIGPSRGQLSLQHQAMVQRTEQIKAAQKQARLATAAAVAATVGGEATGAAAAGAPAAAAPAGAGTDSASSLQTLLAAASAADLPPALAGSGASASAAAAAAALTASFQPTLTGNAAIDNAPIGSFTRLAPLLARFPSIGSRDAADAWVDEFVFGQHCNRPNRARLLRFIHLLVTGHTPATAAAAAGLTPNTALPPSGSGAAPLTGINACLPPVPADPSRFAFYARALTVLEQGVNGCLAPLVSVLVEELKAQLGRRSATPQAVAAAAGGAGKASGGGGGGKGGAGSAFTAAFEGKLRLVRFLAELVKFQVAAPPPLFGVMNRCLSDAAEHPDAVPLLCSVLECVGRYLLLLPETKEHAEKLVAATAAWRAERAGPGSPLAPLGDQIEAALQVVRPPAGAANGGVQQLRVRLRPALHTFVRALILDSLTPSSIEAVLRLLRKLPWQASAAAAAAAALPPPSASGEAPPPPPPPSVEDVVVQTCLTATRLDTSRLALVASLVAGLATYHLSLPVRLVDALVDRLQEALREVPPAPGDAAAAAQQYRRAQRRVGVASLLGECYNYKLCDASTVFRVLFSLINEGHAIPMQQRLAAVEPANRVAAQLHYRTEVLRDAAPPLGPSEQALIAALPQHLLVMPPEDPGACGGSGFHPLVPCATDPPSSLTRLRLACALLSRCGSYFTRGPSAVLLDRFLVFFQRYALSKAPVPVDTEFTLAELYETLRPGFKRAATFAEADAAAAVAEKDEVLAAARLAAEARDAAVRAGVPLPLWADVAASGAAASGQLCWPPGYVPPAVVAARIAAMNAQGAGASLPAPQPSSVSSVSVASDGAHGSLTSARSAYRGAGVAGGAGDEDDDDSEDEDEEALLAAGEDDEESEDEDGDEEEDSDSEQEEDEEDDEDDSSSDDGADDDEEEEDEEPISAASGLAAGGGAGAASDDEDDASEGSSTDGDDDEDASSDSEAAAPRRAGAMDSEDDEDAASDGDESEDEDDEEDSDDEDDAAEHGGAAGGQYQPLSLRQLLLPGLQLAPGANPATLRGSRSGGPSLDAASPRPRKKTAADLDAEAFDRELQLTVMSSLQARRAALAVSGGRISADRLMAASVRLAKGASSDEDSDYGGSRAAPAAAALPVQQPSLSATPAASASQPAALASGGGVRFTLLTRGGASGAGSGGGGGGGASSEAHRLVIPRGSMLAEGALAARAAHDEEQRWLKQRTLQLVAAADVEDRVKERRVAAGAPLSGAVTAIAANGTPLTSAPAWE